MQVFVSDDMKQQAWWVDYVQDARHRALQINVCTLLFTVFIVLLCSSALRGKIHLSDLPICTGLYVITPLMCNVGNNVDGEER